MPNEIERFKANFGHVVGLKRPPMAVDPDGAWVTFADHQAIVAAKDEEIERLKGLLLKRCQDAEENSERLIEERGDAREALADANDRAEQAEQEIERLKKRHKEGWEAFRKLSRERGDEQRHYMEQEAHFNLEQIEQAAQELGPTIARAEKAEAEIIRLREYGAERSPTEQKERAANLLIRLERAKQEIERLKYELGTAHNTAARLRRHCASNIVRVREQRNAFLHRALASEQALPAELERLATEIMSGVPTGQSRYERGQRSATRNAASHLRERAAKLGK